jgi:hypothetical protein
LRSEATRDLDPRRQREAADDSGVLLLRLDALDLRSVRAQLSFERLIIRRRSLCRRSDRSSGCFVGCGVRCSRSLGGGADVQEDRERPEHQSQAERDPLQHLLVMQPLGLLAGADDRLVRGSLDGFLSRSDQLRRQILRIFAGLHYASASRSMIA